MATLPPGVAQICLPGALIESKKGCFSVLCGPIWLMLMWMVVRERRSWEEDEEVGDGEGGKLEKVE